MKDFVRHLSAAVAVAVTFAAIGSGASMMATSAESAGKTVASSRNPSAATASVGVLGWHTYPGERGIDLFVPRYTNGFFDIQASSQNLYWQSSNYGIEGSGSSKCTGKVYMVWYSNGGPWTPTLLQNIVLLGVKAGNSSGSINPYQSAGAWAGQVADSQPSGCGYDPYHFHDSYGTYWGNGTSAIAGTRGSTVYPWTVVIVGRD